jgi:transposase
MKVLLMYSKIQQLKQDGLRKAQAARNLGVDRKIVRKYRDMTLDEYQRIFQQSQNRDRKLDKYKEDILEWLFRHNDYTSAQILDLLWEKYSDEKSEICYSTLRRYVRELRAENNLPKGATPRQYQAIVDPPMGYQAQVDLGYTTFLDAEGKSHDLCVIAMVLSHSRHRHKYFEWFDRPPVATDFINFHERAFSYFGGMPQEIVYDQARLIIINENFGDIIYTLAFENYRQRRKFRSFICHTADPETKGRIEAVVKYVKHNFAKHRIYTTVEELNHQSLA